MLLCMANNTASDPYERYVSSVIPFYERLGGGKVTATLKERLKHRLERDLARIEFEIESHKDELHAMSTEKWKGWSGWPALADLIAEEIEILIELEKVST